MIHDNKKILAEGFKVTSQTSIDDRLVFRREGDLTDLGPGNLKAYTYYEGMVVICISALNKMYVWKESPTGFIPGGFTYPANIIANGINYSGRTFNFVEIDATGANTFYNNNGILPSNRSVDCDNRELEFLGPLKFTVKFAGEVNLSANNKSVLSTSINSNEVLLDSNGVRIRTSGALKLDLNSRGVILPRMPNPSVNIATPEEGEMIVDNGTDTIYVYIGGVWKTFDLT
jgi:hypothetical protein